VHDKGCALGDDINFDKSQQTNDLPFGVAKGKTLQQFYFRSANFYLR